MNQSDFQVYKPHSDEVIMEAVREFNDAMHDDADIEEIEAGLKCLDFLTRASVMSADVESRVYGATVEGEMRLQLLRALDAENRSYDAMLSETLEKFQMMNRSVRSIQHMMHTRVDDIDVMHHINRVVASRAKL